MQAGGDQPGAAVPDTAPADYETVFTNAKAGMEGVDMQRVKDLVREMSKDSAHYKNEQRKQAQVDTRIARLKEQARQLTPAELATHTRAMDAKVAELEAGRDLTRTWLHVDMDAFFAAVEELDNPQLRGKPFAVGGMGMISTASYAARKFGVRSAMPGFIGIKLCPQLIFVRPNFEKYSRASQATREIFRQYDPDFETGSLDEAYLDVTEHFRAHDMTGSQVGEEIRRRVRQETGGLTCSVGVAPNRMLAKVCSDLHKPDGQYVLPPTRQAVSAFVSTLPIRKVPGVGKVTEQTLKALGVQTCRGLLDRRGLLAALFSPIALDFFLHVGLGLGGTRHGEGPREGEVGRKGISCEQTFRAMSAKQELEDKCREICASLAADVAAEGLRGRTVTLKLKETSFEVRTRALTLDRYVSSAEDLSQAALRLLRAELPIEIRLMGVRLSNFYEQKREAGQLSLEDVLSRRQQGQQAEQAQQQVQQQAGGPEGPPCAAGLGTAAAAGGNSSSQGLSQGELVELSLRDWQREGGGQGPAVGEEPPGPAASGGPVSPAAAQQAQQAQQAQHEWACAACTFQNGRLYARCEVCGTARHARAAPGSAGAAPGGKAAAAGGGGAGGRRRGGGVGGGGSGLAGGSAGGAVGGGARTLLGFLSAPKQGPPTSAAASPAQAARCGGGGDSGGSGGRGSPAGPAGSSGIGRDDIGAGAAAGAAGGEAAPPPTLQQQQQQQQQELFGQPGAAAGEAAPQPAGPSGPPAGGGSQEGGPFICSLAEGIAPAPGGPAPPEGGAGGGGVTGAAQQAQQAQQQGAGAGGGGDDLVECEQCRRWVREGELAEHRDWHLALQLQQREERQAAAAAAAAAAVPGPRPPAPGPHAAAGPHQAGPQGGASAGGRRGSRRSAGASGGGGGGQQGQGQGQKRGAGGAGGGAGAQQATLTGMMLKRQKSG